MATRTTAWSHGGSPALAYHMEQFCYDLALGTDQWLQCCKLAYACYIKVITGGVWALSGLMIPQSSFPCNVFILTLGINTEQIHQLNGGPYLFLSPTGC